MSETDSSHAGSPRPAVPEQLAPPPQQPPEQDAAGAAPLGVDDDQDTLDTSFFPSPSPYWSRYTPANLALALDASLQLEDGTQLSRADLEPPNVEWIEREGQGSYSVFGETWPVTETLPRLGEMGVQELFDPSLDRTTSLLTHLRTLLLTYTSLISALLAPPPSLSTPAGQGQAPTDPERLVEHTRLIGVNMHHLINELRPVQARETLKSLMRAQIEQRRAKTAAIKAKCAELDSTLAGLKSDLATSASALSSPSVSSPKTAGGSAAGQPLSARERLREMVDAL